LGECQPCLVAEKLEQRKERERKIPEFVKVHRILPSKAQSQSQIPFPVLLSPVSLTIKFSIK